MEESEKLDLADATQGARGAAGALFPDRRVGLLHGRMKPEEKDAVMDGVPRPGSVHVLVCTTVVEVGVDVPNASVMVIEHAERFGLSQLHQLRGRVGRGAAASFCFLLPAPRGRPEAAERLEVMEQSTDGFVIAEKDLELRGPGRVPRHAAERAARAARWRTWRATRRCSAVAQRRRRPSPPADPAAGTPRAPGLSRALEERWEGRLSLARVG